MLSDADMRKAVDAGDVSVDRNQQPVDPREFRGCSIDLTLASDYYRWRRPKPIYGKRQLDLATIKQKELEDLLAHETADSGGIRVAPGEFILGKTSERIRLSADYAALLTGRSSYSRLGIAVECSQNLLCPGHNNHVPLQIKNNLPYSIIIYPNTPICQLTVTKLSSAANLPYDRDSKSKYVGQSSGMVSQYYRDMNYVNRPEAPVKKRINLSQFLNFCLIVFGLLSGVSLAAAVLWEPEAAELTKRLVLPPLIAILVLVLLARGILLVRGGDD